MWGHRVIYHWKYRVNTGLLISEDMGLFTNREGVNIGDHIFFISANQHLRRDVLFTFFPLWKRHSSQNMCDWAVSVEWSWKRKNLIFCFVYVWVEDFTYDSHALSLLFLFYFLYSPFWYLQILIPSQWNDPPRGFLNIQCCVHFFIFYILKFKLLTIHADDSINGAWLTNIDNTCSSKFFQTTWATGKSQLLAVKKFLVILFYSMAICLW